MTDLEVFNPHNELAAADTHALTTTVKQNFHNIVQDMQPVFQQAHAAATTPDEQQRVLARWEQFQQAVTSITPLTDAVMTTVTELKRQRDVSVTELDQLMNDIERARVEQYTPPPYGDDEVPEDRVQLAYRRYRDEVAELVVAVEDRVNGELEAERDHFYVDTYPCIANSVQADIAAFITVRCDVDDTRYGKALIPLLTSTRKLADDEKQAARVVLERLLETL